MTIQKKIFLLVLVNAKDPVNMFIMSVSSFGFNRKPRKKAEET
jgi:hypothetical protein